MNKVTHYLLEVGGGLSQLLNTLCGGNRDQTFSSRCYEAAVIKNKWYWQLPYQTVNGGAFVLRWTLGRLIGLRFGTDMPHNHCKDAYDFPADNEHNHTYN